MSEHINKIDGLGKSPEELDRLLRGRVIINTERGATHIGRVGRINHLKAAYTEEGGFIGLLYAGEWEVVESEGLPSPEQVVVDMQEEVNKKRYDRTCSVLEKLDEIVAEYEDMSLRNVSVLHEDSRGTVDPYVVASVMRNASMVPVALTMYQRIVDRRKEMKEKGLVLGTPEELLGVIEDDIKERETTEYPEQDSIVKTSYYAAAHEIYHQIDDFLGSDGS